MTVLFCLSLSLTLIKIHPRLQNDIVTKQLFARQETGKNRLVFLINNCDTLQQQSQQLMNQDGRLQNYLKNVGVIALKVSYWPAEKDNYQKLKKRLHENTKEFRKRWVAEFCAPAELFS